LGQVIASEERATIVAEAEKWAEEHEGEQNIADEPAQSIVVTSYEGSKGRSAQYVFLIGVHSESFPTM
jgi:superfamily I DNA/RNA helicase